MSSRGAKESALKGGGEFEIVVIIIVVVVVVVVVVVIVGNFASTRALFNGYMPVIVKDFD